jgi:hypothetical protein
MTINVQQAPYLPRQRNFPKDSSEQLAVEIDKTYIDIAVRVNEKIIGLFPVGFQAVTGEKWYLTGEPTPQQTLREVYTFTGAGSIPHGLNFANIYGFTRIYGTFYSGTNYYPLPYVDATAANNQVQVVVTPTNIVITSGAGAPPAITSGFVVLEWLSQF